MEFSLYSSMAIYSTSCCRSQQLPLLPPPPPFHTVLSASCYTSGLRFDPPHCCPLSRSLSHKSCAAMSAAPSPRAVVGGAASYKQSVSNASMDRMPLTDEDLNAASGAAGGSAILRRGAVIMKTASTDAAAKSGGGLIHALFKSQWSRRWIVVVSLPSQSKFLSSSAGTIGGVEDDEDVGLAMPVHAVLCFTETAPPAPPSATADRSRVDQSIAAASERRILLRSVDGVEAVDPVEMRKALAAEALTAKGLRILSRGRAWVMAFDSVATRDDWLVQLRHAVLDQQAAYTGALTVARNATMTSWDGADDPLTPQPSGAEANDDALEQHIIRLSILQSAEIDRRLAVEQDEISGFSSVCDSQEQLFRAARHRDEARNLMESAQATFDSVELDEAESWVELLSREVTGFNDVRVFLERQEHDRKLQRAVADARERQGVEQLEQTARAEVFRAALESDVVGMFADQERRSRGHALQMTALRIERQRQAFEAARIDARGAVGLAEQNERERVFAEEGVAQIRLVDFETAELRRAETAEAQAHGERLAAARLADLLRQCRDVEAAAVAALDAIATEAWSASASIGALRDQGALEIRGNENFQAADAIRQQGEAQLQALQATQASWRTDIVLEEQRICQALLEWWGGECERVLKKAAAARRRHDRASAAQREALEALEHDARRECVLTEATERVPIAQAAQSDKNDIDRREMRAPLAAPQLLSPRGGPAVSTTEESFRSLSAAVARPTGAPMAAPSFDSMAGPAMVVGPIKVANPVRPGGPAAAPGGGFFSSLLGRGGSAGGGWLRQFVWTTGRAYLCFGPKRGVVATQLPIMDVVEVEGVDAHRMTATLRAASHFAELGVSVTVHKRNGTTEEWVFAPLPGAAEAAGGTSSYAQLAPSRSSLAIAGDSGAFDNTPASWIRGLRAEIRLNDLADQGFDESSPEVQHGMVLIQADEIDGRRDVIEREQTASRQLFSTLRVALSELRAKEAQRTRELRSVSSALVFHPDPDSDGDDLAVSDDGRDRGRPAWEDTTSSAGESSRGSCASTGSSSRSTHSVKVSYRPSLRHAFAKNGTPVFKLRGSRKAGELETATLGRLLGQLKWDKYVLWVDEQGQSLCLSPEVTNGGSAAVASTQTLRSQATIASHKTIATMHMLPPDAAVPVNAAHHSVERMPLEALTNVVPLDPARMRKDFSAADSFAHHCFSVHDDRYQWVLATSIAELRNSWIIAIERWIFGDHLDAAPDAAEDGGHKVLTFDGDDLEQADQAELDEKQRLVFAIKETNARELVAINARSGQEALQDAFVKESDRLLCIQAKRDAKAARRRQRLAHLPGFQPLTLPLSEMDGHIARVRKFVTERAAAGPIMPAAGNGRRGPGSASQHVAGRQRTEVCIFDRDGLCVAAASSRSDSDLPRAVGLADGSEGEAREHLLAARLSALVAAATAMHSSSSSRSYPAVARAGGRKRSSSTTRAAVVEQAGDLSLPPFDVVIETDRGSCTVEASRVSSTSLPGPAVTVGGTVTSGAPPGGAAGSGSPGLGMSFLFTATSCTTLR